MYKYFNEKVSTPLCEIMERNKSDKGSTNYETCWHNYTTFYYNIFKDWQEKPIRLFELGIGTLNPNIKSSVFPDGKPGASLYGWCEFFKNGQIFGADIDNDCLFQTDKIKTFYVDQTNTSIINYMWNNKELEEQFDIIIDDGLHEFSANVCFFENSIQKLRKGGYYIIQSILKDEIKLFEYKILEWRKKYTHLKFLILKINSIRNIYDNNILIAYYS